MYDEMYRDEDLVVLLEWKSGIPIIHHHIWNWKLSTYKTMVREFASVVDTLKKAGHMELYSYYDVDNEKVEKFCKRFGFTTTMRTASTVYVVKEI